MPAAAACGAARAAGFTREFIEDRGWRVVLAAFVGVAFGLSAIPFYTLGTFARPLAADLGWSRGIIQSGLVAAMLGTLASAWVAGWMIDRFGGRRVALISQIGFAIGLVGLGLQTGSVWQWYASWFVMAVLGVGTTPLVWSRGIGTWFVAGRGRALGMALAGTGVTAFAAPPLVTALIESDGWRFAYFTLAAAVLVVALPTVWLLFQEKSSGTAAHGMPTSPGADVSLGRALGGYRFWLLIAAFAAISFAEGGSIPSLIPILRDQGVTGATAALYASLLGLSVIAGRLVGGWLLDRLWAPLAGLLLLAPPSIGCLLLASGDGVAVAAIVIGLAGGAEFDLMAYLSARYFGVRNFGQIYAWQWASFSLAAGAGASCFGLAYDHTHSYAAILEGSAALLLAGPALLLLLGPYPTAFAE